MIFLMCFCSLCAVHELGSNLEHFARFYIIQVVLVLTLSTLLGLGLTGDGSVVSTMPVVSVHVSRGNSSEVFLHATFDMNLRTTCFSGDPAETAERLNCSVHLGNPFVHDVLYHVRRGLAGPAKTTAPGS
mgnify:CR=1 FL=1